MTGLLRKAAMTVVGLAVAATAFAGVPSPGNSSFSASCIKLVNKDAGGVAAPNGAFTVTVRDLANNPIANSAVVLDFANCAAPADIRVQSGGQPAGLVQNCAAHTVRLTSDALGQVTFIVVGGAQNSGNTAGATTGCARVIADGVNLGSIGVAAFDQNGAGGLSPSDIGALVGDLFGGFKSRSDLNCSGDLSPADIGTLVSQLFGPYSTALSGVFCNP